MTMETPFIQSQVIENLAERLESSGSRQGEEKRAPTSRPQEAKLEGSRHFFESTYTVAASFAKLNSL